MKQKIIISISAICILLSFTSCKKWFGIGGSYTEKITLKVAEEFILEGTPDGYGVLMVYFDELCFLETDTKKAVSIYADDIYIGDISQAIGNQDPPYLEPSSDRCISYLLEIGYHIISMKIGNNLLKLDGLNLENFEIKQNYCKRIKGTLPCE